MIAALIFALAPPILFPEWQLERRDTDDGLRSATFRSLEPLGDHNFSAFVVVKCFTGDPHIFLDVSFDPAVVETNGRLYTAVHTGAPLSDDEPVGHIALAAKNIDSEGWGLLFPRSELAPENLIEAFHLWFAFNTAQKEVVDAILPIGPEYESHLLQVRHDCK